jgi:uncharacterized protein YdeI (YjbR/CyaY-like superfamily)
MGVPVGLRSSAAFRAWLRKHHASSPELVVRFFKAHVADPGLTYVQALDEALCFGWIDGVRRRLDDDSYSIRFTPRKPRSIWSMVNVAHVRRLIAAGRMAKPGLAAFEARSEARTGLYSFERAAMTLSPAAIRQFKAERAAWKYFQGEAPWYRRVCTFWVMSAKREATRCRRLEQLIMWSAKGKRIPAVAAPP